MRRQFVILLVKDMMVLKSYLEYLVYLYLLNFAFIFDVDAHTTFNLQQDFFL